MHSPTHLLTCPSPSPCVWPFPLHASPCSIPLPLCAAIPLMCIPPGPFPSPHAHPPQSLLHPPHACRGGRHVGRAGCINWGGGGWHGQAGGAWGGHAVPPAPP